MCLIMIYNSEIHKKYCHMSFFFFFFFFVVFFFFFFFLPGLGLPSPRTKWSYQNFKLCESSYEKKKE